MSADLPPLLAAGDLGILCVMATEHEYGPALRGLLTPLHVGVGPVEAAAGTAAALARLAAGRRLPDAVVSLGSAGSATLERAAVYQVASVAYRDMDASPLGFAAGQVPFADIPPVIAIPHRIDGLPAARLSTGGAVVSGAAAYAAIEADMVDMETYAVLRAAARFGLPTLGLRGISDGRAPVTGLADWTAYLDVIDGRLAAAVQALVRTAEAGRLLAAVP